MNDMSAPSSLVSSTNVNGAAVYGSDGSQVGHIDHLMIDKTTGNIAYAVMGFGGFLGMGEEHHPIPWKKLSYDPSRSGYVTDLNAETLKGAPEKPPHWHRDREWERQTFDHFGVPYYW